jgi:DNA-binding transcriptional regulator YdaS (Cro superfamily)
MKSYRTNTAEQKRKVRSATKRVFKLFDSPAQLARLVGTSRQNVHNWKVRGQIPLTQAFKVATLTEIPVEEIRPDIFAEQ